MEEESPASVDIITADGDVVLWIEDRDQGISQRFRCTRALLRKNSKYLDVLLDPNKFREGISTEDRLNQLKQEYGSVKDIPSHVLPVVRVVELPNISAKAPALKQLLVIVLSIINGIDQEWPISETRAIEKLLQIALLADRLDALDMVKRFIERHLKQQPLPKPKKEITVRQQLLLGTLMGISSYVEWSSALLIVRGSKLWLHEELSDDFVDVSEKDAAWNCLPGGLEGQPHAWFTHGIESD